MAADQRSPQPQAGRWQVAHVAVVGHCSQEEEEEEQEEAEEGGHVAALQILCRGVPRLRAAWSLGARVEVVVPGLEYERAAAAAWGWGYWGVGVGLGSRRGGKVGR